MITCRMLAEKPQNINIGFQNENIVEAVEFDYSAWEDEFGDGTLMLTIKSGVMTEPYLATLDVDGTIATWTVTASDTYIRGRKQAQLTYVVDSAVKKSSIFEVFINPSLDATSETPPEPMQSWFEQVLEMGATVQQSAEDASESASLAQGYAEQSQASADDARESADRAEMYSGQRSFSDLNGNGYLIYSGR